MEIKEIPIPTMPDWLKLYNTYDPEYYTPGKRVSAEEWNTLFLASVRQGNYNADTLELLIKTYLPETYLTQTDFNEFSTQLRADFADVTNEVNSLEERVVNAEDVAYSLNDIIQEANRYAKQADTKADEAVTFAQSAINTVDTAVDAAGTAVSISEEANNIAQTALSNSQTAIDTSVEAKTQSTQAASTANSASLRADDAIATANAAKAESTSAKNTAAQAELTANTSNTTATTANTTASEAKRIAQNALDLVIEGQGSQVLVNGTPVATFNADTKADLDYVDRQIAALIGTAPETLDTLEEVAKAIEENETVVDALNSAIGTKANKADIEPTIQFAESERQKSENLYEYLGDGAVNVGYGYVDAIEYKWTPNKDFARTVFMVCKPNTTYHVTKIAGSRFSVSSFNVTTEDLIPPELAKANVYVTENGEGMNVTYLKITTGSSDNRLAVFCVDTREDTHSVEAVLQSIEVIELGEIIHKYTLSNAFAESERQKSKNLLPVMSTAEIMTIGENGLITLNGNVGAWTYDIFIGEIYLKKGKTYTLSVQNYSGSGKQLFTFQAKKVSDGTAIKDYLYTYGTESRVTPTEDIILTSGGFYFASATTVNFSCFVQIEEGNVVTDYQPYNGAIVHEEQLKDYLPLSGGTLTGLLRVTNGAVVKGRVYGSGDDEGVVVEFADNGYAGVILGSTDARRSCLYLSGGATGTNVPEWRYIDQSGTISRLYHPHKSGTIALTDDIPSGIITDSIAYREFATLLPKNGTPIYNGANLNSVEYLKIGNYYQSGSANTVNMTNIPVHEAFMMTVYSPLSPAYDNETTDPWCYRVRCFMSLTGERWWQYCWTNGTPNSWSYGEWYREIHSSGGNITGTLTISGSINLIV